MVFRFPIYNTGPVKKFFETKSKKNTDKSPIIDKVDSITEKIKGYQIKKYPKDGRKYYVMYGRFLE